MKLNEITSRTIGDLEEVKNYVSGDLNVNFKNLTSLEGCPKEITGNFDCKYNELLTSLEGCPEKIDGYFDCSNNQLSSIKYCTQKIHGGFDCSENRIESLEGCPEKINGNFNCSFNQITSLKDGPREVTGDFDCSQNSLTSFEHFPKRISNDLLMSYNDITSFKDIDQHIEYIGGHLIAYDISYITSGFLDLFVIDGLQEIEIDNEKVQNIVNSYIKQKDLINFQDEMIKSGFESYL